MLKARQPIARVKSLPGIAVDRSRVGEGVTDVALRPQTQADVVWVLSMVLNQQGLGLGLRCCCTLTFSPGLAAYAVSLEPRACDWCLQAPSILHALEYVWRGPKHTQ